MNVATSKRRSASRLFACALSVVGATLALAAARPPKPVATGLTFTYKVVSSSSDKRMKETKDMLATVRLQGGNARMDFTDGKGPMGQKGSYILITSAPPQFAIISDKEKSAVIMDPTTMGSGMGALMNNPMMKLSVTNVKWSFKDLGAGEVIQGYRTRHVRIYSGSDMEMKVLGMSQKSSTSDSSDQWIATGIEVDEEAMAAWGKSFTSGLKSTNPELAAQYAAYQKEYYRKGMALRSTTYSTVTDGKGKVTSDVITMEVTDLKTGAIDPSMFKFPEGYQVTNLGEELKGMQASMDSAKKADGGKEKDKKEAKPQSPGDLVKAGLGGMFKKKPPKDTLS
jgi:hypothetical protein